MNHKDLQQLVDKIEIDSMCRDEVFYDTGKGVTERNTKFFKHIRTLQRYFDYYLCEEKRIMERCDERENEIDDDCPFTSMIKNVNDNQRQKTSVEEE